MEKKEKKKLLLAATLSILSLSNCANAQDVNSWADLYNILKSGQNATLSQSITADKNFIDLEDQIMDNLSIDLGNNSITGTTMNASGIMTSGCASFSLLNGTIKNFVNKGADWGLNSKLGGFLQSNTTHTTNISNVNFINNNATFGGAVANLKVIDDSQLDSQETEIILTSKDTNYTNNKAELGGAVINLTTSTTDYEDFTLEQGESAKNAIVNINAENSDVTFRGNSATIAGGAILNLGTVNIEAAEGQKVEFATKSDDIYNNNVLNLVSGNITINNSAITDKDIDLSSLGLGILGGQGVTNIQNGANVIANAIDQNSLNIANGGTLTTNVNGLVIDNAISNNGTLSLNGNQAQWDFDNPLNNVDVLNENITGTGVTNFVSGNTQVSSNIGTEININGKEININGEGTNVIVSNNNQGTITLGQSGKNITNTNGVLGIDKNVTLAGNLITGERSETEILSAGSITSDVTNDGTIGIFDGTLEHNISGNGTVVVGGELTNNANITAGYIEIDGTSTVLGQNYTGNLITNASNITSTNGIVNDSLLTFTGGTNANSISGDGKTTITGAVVNNATIGQAVDIQSGKLTSSASNLGGAITNAAQLELNGGTLAQNVTGAGSTIIAGDVINNAAIEQVIDIQSGKLTSSASNLGGAITNAAQLELNGGELVQNITGAGSTTILGEVTNSASIGQNVTVASTGNLTSNLADIIGTVTNEGTFNLGDNLSKDIAGAGTTILGTDISLSEDRTVTGTLNLNDKTIAMGNTPAQYTTLNVGNLTGNGNLQIDVDLTDNSGKATSSDKINITDGSSNSGTLNLDVINVENELATSEDVYNDYVDYVTGTTDGLTFTLDGSTDGQIVAVTTDHKYTFTKGSDGSLNVLAQDYTGGLSDYISGEVQANNFSINKDIVLNDNENIGLTQGGDTTKNVFLNNGSTLTGFDGVDKHNNGITVADGYTLNLTGSTDASMENFVTALETNEGGILNVTDMNFSNNTTDIANNGTLNLAGTNSFESGVSGVGNMNITSGKTTNNGTISQNNISIAQGAALNTNASNLTATSGTVTNNGTLEFTGGSVQNNITGNGTLSILDNVTNDKTITQAITNVAEGKTFTNDGVLNSSVQLAANQTINGEGTLNLTGSSSNLGSITQNNVTITNTADLTTAANTITASIANEGKLNLTGGENANAITGNGTTNIQENVINSGSIDNKIAVENGNTLTSSASTLGNKGIANEGTVIFNDGVNANAITGAGTTEITGDVTNNALISQAINVTSGSFTSSADNLGGAVANATELEITGGTLANAITGDGNTTISGNTISNADITQSNVIVNALLTNNAAVTAETLGLNGNIDGSGTLALSGVNDISASSNTITQDSVANSGTLTANAGQIITANGINNTSNLTLKGGSGSALDNSNVITGAGNTTFEGKVNNTANMTQTAVTNSGELTNTGIITAAVTNSGTLTSSADNIAGTVDNTGTYNVQGGTIANAISGNGDVNLSGNVISNANNTVTGNVTVAEGATLSKGVSGNLFSDAAALNLENGATLSLADGTVATTTSIDNLAIAQGSTAKLELDWGDSLNTTNSDAVAGNIELSKVDLTTKSDDTPFTVSSTLQDKISLSSDIELVADEDSNYVNYDATKGQFNADKLTLNDAIAQGDANGVYQMTADESLSAGLGTLQGSDNTLSVNGGGYSIIGNDNEGVTVNDGQTLNLTNIKEIGGFKDSTAVTNNGTVNLSNVALNDKVAGSGDLNVNGDTTFNNAVSGNTLNLNSGVLALGQAADISGANAFVVNGGALNLQNNAIQNTNLGNVTLNSDLDLRLDGNFAQQQIDTITANSFTDNGNHINISNILITEPTTEKSFSISPLGTGMDDSVRTALAGAIQYTGGEIAYSPIYKYTASYDPDSAMLKFGLVGGGGGGSTGYESFNPAIMASPVAAQLGGYLVQLNSYDNAFRNMDMYMLMTKEQRQAMKMRNKYASANSRDIVFDPTVSQYENKAGWFRPFATFENVHLDNGPRVSNVAYGSYFGADSELYDLGNGWDGMWSVYAGYNGSHQAYDGIGIYQNGGTLGAVGMAYKGNYFAGLTANIGASAGEANSMFGREDFTMLMSGVAAKTGYNWELAQGKFIIQPSMLMSYSFVNTFDYHNAAGVGINSDPLHAIQLEPGLKFIGNLKNGWQPYLGVSVVWNIMDNTQFRANDVSLPSLSVDPYVRYGVGVRKAWGEKFTGFLQAYFTNGGRNGVGLMAGFRFTVGKSTGSSIKADNFTPEKLKTQVSLKSMK